MDKPLNRLMLVLLVPVSVTQALRTNSPLTDPVLGLLLLLLALCAIDLRSLQVHGRRSRAGDLLPLLGSVAVVLALHRTHVSIVMWVPVMMFFLFVRFRARLALVLSLSMMAASVLLVSLHWREDGFYVLRVVFTLSFSLILLTVFFVSSRRTMNRLRVTTALLDSSMKAMAQGLMVIGVDGRIRLFNDQVGRLLNLPQDLLQRHPALSEIVEFQHARGDFGPDLSWVQENARASVANSGLEIDGSMQRVYTRRTADGRVIEVTTLPMPNGDVVRTYSDVTPYELVNQQLQALLKDFNLLRQREMDRSREQLIVALSQLSQFRDNETGQHILRTQMYLRTLAQSARRRGYCSELLSDEVIEQMAKAAPMHDLGKIGIPDHILHKPGRHTEEETAIMRTHVAIGEATLTTAAQGSASQQSVLLLAARIAGGHHENWDGSGYPRGLTGPAIPLEARLMALADVYDALTTARPYKPAWTHEQAMAEIRRLRGLKFDPQLVDALEAEEAAFQSIAMRLADPAP